MKLKLLIFAVMSFFYFSPQAYCGISVPGPKVNQPQTKQPRYKMKYGTQEQQQSESQTWQEQASDTVSKQNFEGYDVARSSSEKTLNYSCTTNSDNIKYCLDANKKPLEGKVGLKNSDGGYISIENYKKGYLNGLASYFYENGNPKLRLYYKEGQKNGMYKLYHLGRGIEISANYKNNKLDGGLDVYLADGTLYGRMKYRNGKLEKGYCNKNGKKENFSSAMLKSHPNNQIYSCGIPIWQPE